MKNKYQVGFPGEFIGVYYGIDEQEAIINCKQHMANEKFEPDTPIRERITFGMIAKLIEDE